VISTPNPPVDHHCPECYAGYVAARAAGDRRAFYAPETYAEKVPVPADAVFVCQAGHRTPYAVAMIDPAAPPEPPAPGQAPAQGA
jgi:hypothetical protein